MNDDQPRLISSAEAQEDDRFSPSSTVRTRGGWAVATAT